MKEKIAAAAILLGIIIVFFGLAEAIRVDDRSIHNNQVFRAGVGVSICIAEQDW